MLPFFAELINANKLFGCHYCEPYAGGAGLAIELLTGGFVGSISINDLDPGVFSFWSSVFSHPDDLCRKIESAEVSVKEWQRQREIWRRQDSKNQIELGFATFFLNRTNRSGIIDGAGPIGGFKQEGTWKIDARFNKESQIERIRCLSRLSHQVSVTNKDASSFIKSKLNRRGAVLYLDPPYYVKGQKLYSNFYEHSDHVKICRQLSLARDSVWVVSYDQAPEIKKIYREFRCIEYRLNYSAAKKLLGTEYIFLSDAIKPPAIQGFRMVA